MVKTLIDQGEALAQIFIADTFLKRFMGYMFRKKPHHDALLLNPCDSIHTCFMQFPIDVLFIDENMEVVKKLEGLKAGKFIVPVKKAKMVIEGKAGLFEKVKLGSKLKIIE